MTVLVVLASAGLLLLTAGVWLTRASKDPQTAYVGTGLCIAGVVSLAAHASFFLLRWAAAGA